jgi:hypothetical protein
MGRKKKEAVEFVMPSNPSDIQKIENAVKEASNSLIRIEAERDLIKDIKERMQDELGIPAKKLQELIKIYHKQNYSEVVGKFEETSELYEKVFGATP